MVLNVFKIEKTEYGTNSDSINLVKASLIWWECFLGFKKPKQEWF